MLGDSKADLDKIRAKIEMLGAKVVTIDDKKSQILCSGEKALLDALQRQMTAEGLFALEFKDAAKKDAMLLVCIKGPKRRVGIRFSATGDIAKGTTKGKALLFALAFFIGGIYLGRSLVRDIILMHESQSWVPATAIIDNEDVSAVYGRYGTYYYPHVIYHFSASGINDAIGNHFSIPSSRFSTRESAQRELAKYPEGSTVQIYYNPNNLSHNSLIRPHMDYFYIFGYGWAPSLLLCLSIFFAIQYLQLRKRDEIIP
jgi:hypothetical protein